MKKLIAALTLTTLSLSSFAAVGPTQADLVLQGTIEELLSITIVHEEVASELDLTENANGLKVATLTEKSNYHTGYKVFSKSINEGKLKSNVDQNSFVNYTLTYEGNNVSLTSTPTLVYNTNNLRGTFNKVLRVSYTGNANLPAGVYSDTVQFTIQAN